MTNKRLTTLAEWGSYFDSMNYSSPTNYKSIEQHIKGALTHDNFHLDVKNRCVFLYPRESQQAHVCIRFQQNQVVCDTTPLWAYVDTLHQETI